METRTVKEIYEFFKKLVEKGCGEAPIFVDLDVNDTYYVAKIKAACYETVDSAGTIVLLHVE